MIQNVGVSEKWIILQGHIKLIKHNKDIYNVTISILKEMQFF